MPLFFFSGRLGGGSIWRPSLPGSKRSVRVTTALQARVVNAVQLLGGHKTTRRIIGQEWKRRGEPNITHKEKLVRNGAWRGSTSRYSFCYHLEEADLHQCHQILTCTHLKKKFYFHFQDYVDLIIWKVSRSSEQNLAFFAVYNMETTDIVSLYQNSSEELYSLFEYFYDHFHTNPQNSSHGNFISSHSNNVHALDQLRTIKNKASSSSQFVKKMMASLPYTCQSQSPSPYFDLSLFRYDKPNVVKFKIKPGSDSGASDSRAKRISSFLFHPFFPLALSIQQTYMQPTVVNLHFRR
uniref:Light-mediated development protein DET1 n=1 Tax=Oryza rufipogon TaxID=4529 RepID=A0A0E0MWS1_ORYRU